MQKPKAVDKDGAVQGTKGGKLDPGSRDRTESTSRKVAVTVRKGKDGSIVPKKRDSAQEMRKVRRASTRAATRLQEERGTDLFIPERDRELLESMSGKKGRKAKDHISSEKSLVEIKAKIRGKKNLSKASTDGLEELHRALHLSSYEGIDDVSKVIQAEPLEDRKARMMAEHSTKKKRGRPRKNELELKAAKKSTLIGDEQSSGVIQCNEQEHGEDIDDGKLAIVKVEEEDTKRPSRKQDNLADKQLDVENWSLKDIVKWGNARERKLAKEQAKSQPKSYSKPVHLHEKEPQPLYPKVHVKDGKVVVDQESLTVAAQQKEEYTKIVTEDSHTINSMSYVNRLSNDRWSIQDTELFFRALSQFGTDFTLIAQLFPGRQRKHLKKKFCKEGKVNAARVDAAMRASAHATINSYKEMITLLKQSGMNVGSQSQKAT